MRKMLLVSAAMAALSFGPSAAQDMPGMKSDAAFAMPEACETAAQEGMAGMKDMPGSMKGMGMPGMGMPGMEMKGMGMEGGGPAMPGMDDAQKESMAGMMTMRRAMMAAHMIKDPDLAFVCGMIAHHRGAVVMSKIELENGKDEQAKTWARKIIEDQEKEIAEFAAWAEKRNAR